MSAPSGWPAEKPWPPRRAVDVAFDGALEVAGQLVRDAELRMGTAARTAVLLLSFETGRGFAFEAIQPVSGDPAGLNAARELERSLRRGRSVRVAARGCIPRYDHGTAVLQLLDVTKVDLI